MEYWNLILQAFSAALDWFGMIMRRDQWLFSTYLGLVFATMVTALFISPFISALLQGGIYSAGSDWARIARKNKNGKSSSGKKK